MKTKWNNIEIAPTLFGKYLICTRQYGILGERFVYTAYWSKDNKGNAGWVVSDREFWKYKMELAYWCEMPKPPKPDKQNA